MMRSAESIAAVESAMEEGRVGAGVVTSGMGLRQVVDAPSTGIDAARLKTARNFFENRRNYCNLPAVSTVQEIKEAIAQLPEEVRMTLLQWIHTKEEADTPEGDAELLRQAEEGARQLEAGRGVTLERARKLTSCSEAARTE
jgi:hypothetical protein